MKSGTIVLNEFASGRRMTRQRSKGFYLTEAQRTVAVGLQDARPTPKFGEAWLDWKQRVILAAKEFNVERKGYFYAYVCGQASGLGDKSAESFKEWFETS